MPATAQQTIRRRIEDAGLTLIAISSYIKICSPEPDADVSLSLQETLELAAALGAGGVRIFPGADTTLAGATGNRDQGLGSDRSGQAVCYSRSCVRILRLVEPSGTTRAIWDVLHPWRHGEQPEDMPTHYGSPWPTASSKMPPSGPDPTVWLSRFPGKARSQSPISRAWPRRSAKTRR